MAAKILGKSSEEKRVLEPSEWVDSILVDAKNSRASDIHFDPYTTKFYVRFRTDGALYVVSEQPLGAYQAVVSRLKVIGQLDITEKRKPQDGRGQLSHPDLKVPLEFRVSTLPTIFGEAVVVRFVNQQDALFDSFESMGMSPADAEVVRDAIHKRYGLVLVAGPGGSGKTTTLYTAINQIRSPEKSIITLEDPVEFQLEFVRHAQIKPDIGFTYAEGMKAILRQDPDVVFIGEVRDNETAEIAVRAALSGRLVFSNIATSDSVGTIARFLELGIPRSFLSSTLSLTVSKRLLRKNCESCSKPYVPSEKLLKLAGLKSAEGANFLKGAGCEKCDLKGYRERIPIFELFVVDAEIANLITEGATTKEILEAARGKGMKTLREAGIALAAGGATTLEEAVYTTPA